MQRRCLIALMLFHAWAYGVHGEDTAWMRFSRDRAALVIQERFAEALTAAVAAVEAARAEAEPSDSILAQCSYFAGALHAKMGNWSEAQQSFLQSLASLSNANQMSSMLAAECLNSLGEIERKNEEYHQAEHHLQQAYSVAEKYLDQFPGKVIAFLNNLGEVYREQGKYQDADDAFGRALDACGQSVTNAGILAPLLRNYGYMLLRSGKYPKAQMLLDRALDECESAPDRNRENVAAAFNDLALLKQEIGDYQQAMGFYMESLTIYTNVSDGGCDSVNVLNNIGALYQSLGMLGEAESSFVDALAVAEKEQVTNRTVTAQTLNNMAVLCRLQGRLDDAENFYLRAIAIAEAVHGETNLEATVYRNNLAKLYTYCERYEEAERLCLRSYDDAVRQFGPSHPDTAAGLHNLSVIYSGQSNHLAALGACSNALVIREHFYGTNHLAYATTLFEAAGAYMALGDLPAAVEAYRRVLATREEILGKAHHRTAEVLWQLARLSVRRNELAAARGNYQRALAALERASGVAGGEQQSGSIRATQNRMCDELLEVLWALTITNPSNAQRYAADAFDATELCRARVFLDQLSAASASEQGGMPLEEQERMRALRFEVDALDKAKEALSADKDRDTLVRLALQSANVRAELAKTEDEIKQHYPRYAEMRYPRKINIGEVQSAVLLNDEAMVSYWVGESNLFACVITTGTCWFAAQPLSRQQLGALVSDFWSIHTLNERGLPSTLSAFRPVAEKMYREVFAPFESALPAKGLRVLYVVPHGPLCNVPFDSVTRPGDATSFGDLRYLLLDVPIAYVPSAQVLRAIRNDAAPGRFSKGSRRPALLFGDPVYSVGQVGPGTNGGRSVLSLNKLLRQAGTRGADTICDRQPVRSKELEKIPALPSTREEVETLGAILYGGMPEDGSERVLPRILTGVDASESRVKGLSERLLLLRYRYVHFATHGMMPGDLPGLNEASVLLSLFGDTENDGFLTMHEVLGLRLDADMVTLSACKTGYVANPLRGEGLSDLARAFLYAGSPRLTVTLWSIADEATKEFMKVYYAELRQGHTTTLEAMRKAKRALVKNRAYQHPFFWAAFVLIGENR